MGESATAVEWWKRSAHRSQIPSSLGDVLTNGGRNALTAVFTSPEVAQEIKKSSDHQLAWARWWDASNDIA
jgi:hypothetical protein